MTIQLTDWGRSTGVDGKPVGCKENDRPNPLPHHVGLWLDRCLAEAKPTKPESKNTPSKEDTDSEWGARDALYATAIDAFSSSLIENYRPCFERWRRAITASNDSTVRRAVTLTTTSRLLLHPAANESVTEGSLLLHHTYGVPYIPGSALKGAVRSRLERLALAHNDDTEKQELTAITQQLLGYLDNDQGQASAIDFLDALWIPPTSTSGSNGPLALDIVNVHHPDYYTRSTGTRKAPTDLDDPTVIHRLTVAPKVEFLCVIEARQQEGVEEWLNWLDWLIGEVLATVGKEDGLGAATSVGYGRFGLDSDKPETQHNKPSRIKEDEWQEGNATYKPQFQELHISLKSGDCATATNQKAREIIGSLSSNAEKKLRKGTRLEVQTAPQGTTWEIIKARWPQ